MTRVLFPIVLFSTLILVASSASANRYDLTLSRLCQIELADTSRKDCGGGYDPSQGVVTRVIADDASFRALMSELGVVFAPNILSPADTQGFAGFNISVELGFTKINPKRKVRYSTASTKDSTQTLMKGQPHEYWRAANSVKYNAFEHGDITSSDPKAAAARLRLQDELPSSIAPTISIMVRKGLWLPIPSFELGVGVRYLIGSRMWGPTVMAKVALTEGFQGWPLPAIAVRGTGVRVVGTPDFNLTVAGLDFSASKHLGIASTFNITPFVGYQLLWIIADSEILDATPGVDAVKITNDEFAKGNPLEMNRCQASDCNGHFTFADQSNITRHRLFFGAKLNFYFFSFLLEYSFFLSGSKSDNIVKSIDQNNLMRLNVPDSAGAQHSFAFSLQLDY